MKNRLNRMVMVVVMMGALGGFLAAPNMGCKPAGPAAKPFKEDTSDYNKKAAPSAGVAQLQGLQTAFVEVSKHVKPAVVNISTTGIVKTRRFNMPEMPGMDEEMKRFFGDDNHFFDEQPETRQTHSLGSGFIVNSEGYIVTNFHVVNDAAEIEVKLNDGRTFKGKVMGTDNKTDIAVLKIDTKGEKLPDPVVFGDSDKLQVGEWVVAIGNPFGLEQTVTAGIVSAKDRAIGQGPYDDFLQTDAAINPGNSGGPLIDIYGRVVGINTAIFSQRGGFMGISFAIPINMAKNVLEQLISKGKITRGWLGIGIMEVNQEVIKKYKLPAGSKGVFIMKTYPGYPAYDAGMRPYDLITTFDGKPVENPRALQQLVAATLVGKEVEVLVLRAGERKTLHVKVSEMPEDTSKLEQEQEEQGQP